MKNLIRLEKKIVPEIVEILTIRYDILWAIYSNQPIGRRVLAQELKMGERVVRKETDSLKEQGLIASNSLGMALTCSGFQVLQELMGIMHEIKALSDLEIELEKKLLLKEVIIVPGNSDEDSSVKDQIGIAASNYIKRIVKDNMVIALTGGTTVRKVVLNMKNICNVKSLMVLPARGGMGKKVESQADTLTAILAEKLNASYKLLHLTDNISNEVLNIMLKEKNIKEITELFDNIDILIYGVGKAEDMAKSRGISDSKIDKLMELGAVGEAFGYYFDKSGNILYSSTTVGMKIDQIRKVKYKIAVCVGAEKAPAIVASLKKNVGSVLITDEAAALEMLKII
ncbi:MAG: sugar-binding transcriptional regulator [Clostridiaceae bacterium]